MQQPAELMDSPGIYIHIPYCRSKCGYCSFNSYPCPNKPSPDYLAALISQIKSKRNSWAEKQVFHSIYIGGGTPTIYDGDTLAKLIKACLSNYKFITNPEISLETNPNTATITDLEKCQKAGANRLSIGVQSFNNDLLGAMGRTHTASEASQAFLSARKAGFNNISLDLMFGLPNQSIADWQHTLSKAVNLEPEHLALYELTIEENTHFHALYNSRQLHLPDHDLVADMAEYTYAFLEKAGYNRYEISNFSKPGFTCQHNTNYWQNGSYMGLGAGAVSCFSGLRMTNVNNPDHFINLTKNGQTPFQDGEGLSHEASFRESVIMGMRMLCGVDLQVLQKRYGIDPSTYYGSELDKLVTSGFIKLEDNHMRLTRKALPLANQVLSELV